MNRTLFLALSPGKVYHLDGTPNLTEPDWPDVHRTLARTTRFGGRSPWSVLSHALAVRHALVLLEASPMAVHHGFFHDHHEALVGDVPYPIGRALGSAWVTLEKSAEEYTRRWFDWSALTADDAQLVHDVDVAATYVEALMAGVAKETCPWVATYIAGNQAWWATVAPLLREGYSMAGHDRIADLMSAERHLTAIPRVVSS